MRRGLVLWLLVSLLPACQRHGSGTGAEEQAEKTLEVVDEGCPHMVDGKCEHEREAPAAAPRGDTHAFGKALGQSPQASLADVLSEPDRFHDKMVRVEGHVTRACSRKGCWMELAVDSSPDAARCRVTFQDYGFFVPTDSAGSDAKLEGRVQVTRVKPAAVKHYESEGARFPRKAADGSAREVRLIATGVELERI